VLIGISALREFAMRQKWYVCCCCLLDTISWCTAFVLLVFALLLGYGAGIAGAATYAYRNDVFAYDTPSGAASTVTWHTTRPSPACTGYPNGDDDWADIMFPGGFSFTFGGTNYTGVRVYSNGILAFGNDVSGFHRDYTPQALPAPADGTYTGCPTAAPVNLMLAYWIDIVAGTANSTTNASVKYELLGSAPNRRFVISWVNVKLYNQTARYNFQVTLYEGTAGVNGNFKYQYTSGSSDGSNATVGVQLSQADFTQYSYNQQFIDTTNGTAILWYPANQLATKVAEYRFDESSWAGVAGEVKDTSGNSQDATRVGAAANVAGGKLCRGGSFTSNTSNTTIDGVATPIVPGNTGSIDFWYKSTDSWSTGNTMLFDATTVANRPFFLMKRDAGTSGSLRFVISDSAGTTVTANSPNQTFAADTWVHVGVSWNMRVGTNQTAVQIFINGVLQNGAPTRGTTNGIMPNLSSLYIGDNRTSGITPANGTPNGANGIIDEVYVYLIEISAPQVTADMNLTRPVCTVLDHFHIIHDGAVSSCAAPASITIEAHDASHALFTLAGTSMNLSTTPAHGTWSNLAGGAINSLTAIGAGTGTATYTFANENRVTFGLSNTLSEALNINVSSGTITEHSGTASSCVAADYTTGTVCDANRTFVCAKPFGFNCVESGGSALTGHLYTKLAGTAFSFDVVALKDGDNNGTADSVETAYASDVDKDVTVELVDGSGATACASRVAISPAVSQTLTFTTANQLTELGRKATANMTVAKAYPDLRCRVTDASESPSIVGCSTDNFAVRPGAVALSTTASATPPSAVAAPKVKAGAAFTVTAATSTAAADTYTGALTLDTGKLTAQITSQDITQQSGGTVGTLSPASLTANQSPAPSNNGGYTEAGFLYLAPGAYRDDNFTGVDQPAGCAATNICDCVTSTTGDANLAASLSGGKIGCSIGNTAAVAFGRFIPHHLIVAISPDPPGFADSCAGSAFTYLGQSFNWATVPQVTIRAMNSAGALTQNYEGVFWKLADPLALYTYVDASALAAVLPLTPGTSSQDLPDTSTCNGEVTIPLTEVSGFHYVRPVMTIPVTPFVPDVTLSISQAGLTDTDGVCYDLGAGVGCQGFVRTGIAGNHLRHGQLKILNNFGPETADITRSPFEAQYYNGTGWVVNVDDTCTTGLAFCPAARISAIQPDPLATGRGTFTVSHPASSETLAVCPTAPAWLSALTDCTALDSSCGEFTFGIYRGNDRIINWREVLR
jgi:MSHA biogenesis protein MshQ